MEPTELYNRSKRNLAIFAALLGMILIGGIKPIDEQKEILSFKISAPELIPAGICAITIYCLYQYILAWSFQADALRARIRHDFYVAVIIPSVAILYYLGRDVAPLIEIRREGTLLALAVGAATVATAIALFRTAELIKWRREAFSLRRNTLQKRLEQPGWVLNFNPQIAGGSKSIEFLRGGDVGDGKNDNEHSWTLSGNELTIKRKNGALQNRFRYDESIDRFVSTDEEASDAIRRGIKGQYIYRPQGTP